MNDMEGFGSPGYRPPRKRPGPRRHYESQQLMEVWIYVRVGMVRTKLNANAFCTKKRKVIWLEGGPSTEATQYSPKITRPLVVHTAAGKTLWRRYQEAVAFLKAESKRYYCGQNSKSLSDNAFPISPTEQWWRRELKLALARF